MPDPMAPTNMQADVRREADERRAIPLSPWPEAHPPASRAPISTRKPPTKLESAVALLSTAVVTPERRRERNAPATMPSVLPS